MNEYELRNVKVGDRISARMQNEILRVLRRRVTGPFVRETSDGWHVRRDNTGTSLVAENPDQVGTTSEIEPAQIDDWDQSDQGEFDGVIVTMQTRSAYNHLGDQKLYAFYRDVKFDVNGRLMTISAETRVTIDTPEVCP